MFYHRADLNQDPALKQNNGESIQLGSGVTYQNGKPVKAAGEQRTIVEHNLFEDIGESQEMISNKTRKNVFRYNTFRKNRDRLVLRIGTHAQVYENWFLETEGLRIHESGHDIHDNYMENVSGSAFLLPIGKEGYDSDGNPCLHWPANQVSITRNTVVGTSAPVVVIGSPNGSGGKCTYDQTPAGGVYTDNLFVDFATSAFVQTGTASQTYSGNIAWPKPAKASSTGVTFQDPQLEKNALGYRVSKTFPERGATLHCRALTVADVGPSSTFSCD
ncbi:MAG: hypothetical protein EOO75_03345 [Myxococcales bacterium]|nr:MAG: hypothetical protein EOO75_03345 [Myxococcales bacterium]